MYGTVMHLSLGYPQATGGVYIVIKECLITASQSITLAFIKVIFSVSILLVDILLFYYSV